ncbi:30S ribosome-binding factor RbfA [Tautonia sp. JC769]|uniref:30S ribosome-binding factor RbfA n=1 Tax=Tautonia sp. JC769 TaxID=3232135 RepID=UPI00345AD438
MPSHRIERLNEAVREVVSSAVLFEVADPRVKGVTVLEAEVASDLKHATVFVSVMGDETQQRLALRGLQSASGFLQSRLAARLKTRYTPILRFELDQGVKKSVAMSRLIDETLAADRLARGESPEAPGPDPDDDEPSRDALGEEHPSSTD